MAIDFREIQLTDEQKRRLAELAEQTGKAWTEILTERLTPFESPSQLRPGNGDDEDQARLRDREAWLADFNAWIATQRSHNPNFDDSRENIYPDRC